MIGYVTLGTNNLDAARVYYDALLALLGAKRTMDSEAGGFTSWGRSLETPGLALTRPHDGGAASVGNGCMVALAAETRAKVDEVHAKALELGGSDEGAPGLRGEEGPHAFYAGYFRDPEGNKLCVFRVGPA